MAVTTVNPATGTKLAVYPLMPWGELEARVGKGWVAQKAWAAKALPERLLKIRALGQCLADNRERYALQMTLEMGKPAQEARAEVDKCVLLCQTYADRSMEWMKDETLPLDGIWSKVRLEPLGTVLAVMPWNFPFWQAFRVAVPALVMGNGCMLRHASNVTGSALLMQEAFDRAAFPADLFQTVVCTHADVEKLIAHPMIAGVSFTGSTEVGSRIAKCAGEHLKKTVLELGGSDPFVVLEDANIPKAAKAAAQSRLLNAGQSCISAKRFLVHEKAMNEFMELFVGAMAARKMGDPQDLGTELGPLVNDKAAHDLDHWVQDAEARGAKVHLKGKREGAYLSPSVLSHVPEDCALSCKEVFGPIAVVRSFKTDEEALHMANGTEFGLASCVWSMNLARAENFARHLEAGSVFINAFPRSDPRMPFGGIKKSGMGRELGRYGLLEFANVKAYSAYL